MYDIDVLSQWSKEWLLCFNVSKCKVLHIGNTPYAVRSCLSDNMRDLGVLMDSKLKFHMHTDSVVNKAYCVLGLINKSFKCKDPDIVLKLYKSLVCPIVEYANVIWGPHYILDQQKVEQIQRKATRIIPSLHGSTYNNRMRILSLPPLQY